MISHEHKFIFSHIPKCGGTSIEEALFSYADESTGEKWAVDNKCWRNKMLFDLIQKHTHYHVFTFMRHPVDRFLSTYNHLINNKHHDYCLAKFIHDVNMFLSKQPEVTYKQLKNNETRTLDLWIPEEWYKLPEHDLIGYHVLPQIYFITPKMKVYDFVNIKKEFLDFCTQFKIPITDLPRVNGHEKFTTQSKVIHKHDLSSSQIEKIRNIYTNDLRHYNNIT